jgi:serine/threonine protein kinase
MKNIGGFTLLERLGKGADGDVWKVKDSEGALSALKFCPVSETNSTFHIEFQRLKRINIDGVINVHACGEENGLAYYSMDLIIGSNLRDYAHALPDSPDRFEQLFRIFAKITLVLSQLHQMGITHLDVKPENIIIQENGEPTLLDFGRAVALGERKTQHGSFVYMSPEQRLHFPCTERSDVYSIAVTMVEIFTGKAPPHTQIGTPWKPLFHHSKHLNVQACGHSIRSVNILRKKNRSLISFSPVPLILLVAIQI